MASAKKPEFVDAQLSHQQMTDAIRKIERRLRDLNDFDEQEVENSSDPNVSALQMKLNDLLVGIFGTGSTQYQSYQRITSFGRGPIILNRPTTISETRQAIAQGVAKAKAALETIKQGFQEELEDAGESETGKPLRAYEGLDLHPEINRQVGGLYCDGHYAEAVEKSVNVLNNLVRLRSSEELDGNALMEKVFSPSNPILWFNDLADDSDKNEQKGVHVSVFRCRYGAPKPTSPSFDSG